MNKEKQLNKIRKQILETKLPLQETAKNLVFGKGNPNTNILFIGEAPGAKEDEQGIPFVGAAGRELNKLLQSINLNLEKVYIANILKYRPPKNRNPNNKEIESHTPFLIKQIEIIKPKIIATLGNYSTKFILAKFETKEMKKIPGISKLHGETKEIQINENTYKIMPLYHPAAMLYNPKLRTVLEEDFKKIKKELQKKIK
ncbi:uracil-DNA glycosylase [Candidatus Woesearchaeota archaeon]|nr:uracil-DNA glycosylase [Candidatus Woesearchaeota archaeon]MCF8013582.1 uracil-DNA glycosylase [Candidatus Woesearchaeota archaeon]